MVFDFTVGKVRSLLLKVRSGTLNAFHWFAASFSARPSCGWQDRCVEM